MDLIENGKDANEVLKMPFHYVLSIYQNKNNDISEEKAEALIDAFNLNRLVRVIFWTFLERR